MNGTIVSSQRLGATDPFDYFKPHKQYKVRTKDDIKWFFDAPKGIKRGKHPRIKTRSVESQDLPSEVRKLISPLLRDLEPQLKTIAIERERMENKKSLDIIKDELQNKHLGKYVVIANGMVKAIGNTYEEVKDKGLDSNHRFIFCVEDKEPKPETFRWPVRTQ